MLTHSRTLLFCLLLIPFTASAYVFWEPATLLPSELHGYDKILGRSSGTPQQQLEAAKEMVRPKSFDTSQASLQRLAAVLGRLPDNLLEQVLASPQWQARSPAQRLTLLSCWLHPSLPLLRDLDTDRGSTKQYQQDLQQERARRTQLLLKWAKFESVGPDSLDEGGWRLLDLAVGSNHLQAVQALLQQMHQAHDAPPPYTWQHPGGLVPLAIATPWEQKDIRTTSTALNDRLQIVQLLLQHQATVNSTDLEGRTALELLPYTVISRSFAHTEWVPDPHAASKQQLFQLLLTHGIRPPAQGPEGDTLLDLLTETGEYALLPQAMILVPETLTLSDGSQRSSRLGPLCTAARRRHSMSFAALKPDAVLLAQACPQSSLTLRQQMQARNDEFLKQAQQLLPQLIP